MLLEDEDIKLLTQIGFTGNQSKLYLTLLKIDKASGTQLAKHSGLPRPVVYRTLKEIQKMGLVEQELTKPYKFKAIPVKDGLEILMIQRLQQYKEMREKTRSFLAKYQHDEKQNLPASESKFIIVEGKDRVIQMMRLMNNKVKKTVRIISTYRRWLHSLEYCVQNYRKALTRNVKFQVILETTEDQIVFPKKMNTLLTNDNFSLRIHKRPLKTNLGIFDEHALMFNLFPSHTLEESQTLWTNHTSFISMSKDHFSKIWTKSIPY